MRRVCCPAVPCIDHVGCASHCCITHRACSDVCMLPTSLASRGRDLTPSIDVLLAAVLRAACRPCVYGPLWGHRVSRRSKCRIELVVYDCFCMVFLNRPGCYYKVDQWARIARGDVQPARIISSLQVYHHLLVSARGVGALSRVEVKAWWLMPAETRRWINERVVASGTAPFDYAYVPFLTSFLPQSMSPQTEWRFFDSLLHYIPLLFSDNVELRVVDVLADDSAVCYGVFARRELSAGVISDVRGQLVRLSAAEKAAVRAYGSDHSLLHMMRRGAHRINVPDGAAGAHSGTGDEAAARGPFVFSDCIDVHFRHARLLS